MRKPAIILGVVLLAAGVFVQLQCWNLMPVWYHLSFLALLIPGVMLGARLRIDRRVHSVV